MHMHSIFIHNDSNVGCHLKHVTLLLEQSNRQNLKGWRELLAET